MIDELAIVCKELRLGDLGKLATQVAFENEIQYLTDVLKLVANNREAQRIERLTKQAKFPVIKTFDGYKFDPITWPN